MVYLLKLLLFLIDTTQKTILNGFGIGINQSIIQNYSKIGINEYHLLNYSSIEMSSIFSIETLQLLISDLWENFQRGLSISDIDNLVITICVIRFIILAIRYNILTSFVITSISFLAAYIWYKHFITLLVQYQTLLIKIGVTKKLGYSITAMKQRISADVNRNNANVRLTNPIGIILHALSTGSLKDGYRIDPLSMSITKIPIELRQSTIEPIYYLLYRKLIPLSIKLTKMFYKEFSSVLAYGFMVRMGKRYVPYLIRWHWSMLITIVFLERFWQQFMGRCFYYSRAVLLPQVDEYSEESINQYLLATPEKMKVLIVQSQILEFIATAIILMHLAFVLYALLHAVFGQYFYIPVFTKTVELHVGLRDKTSIYSGGNTTWQDLQKKEKKLNLVNALAIKLQKFLKKLLKLLKLN